MVSMDGGAPGSSESSGSVRAAVHFYGGMIHAWKPVSKSEMSNLDQDSNLRTKELHQAKLSIHKLSDSKTSAEKERVQAESELVVARTAVNQLAQQIDESNARANARRMELQAMRNRKRINDEITNRTNNHPYGEVVQELNHVKLELGQLKLDVASALEAKSRAEKEIEVSSSKAVSYESSLEKMRKELDEVNEEHVLVELARMEAEREHREVETERQAEAIRFTVAIEEARKRAQELRMEICRAKELEKQLAITTSDVSVLQTEMELVRAMERNFPSNHSKVKERDSALQSAQTELKAAKRELAAIKEEGFRFIASMNIVREELAQVAKEADRLSKMEKKADSAVQHLNSKLLKAKSKLEDATKADEKAKEIVTNLSVALQQLQLEIESANREKELTIKETTAMRVEIEKTGSSIDAAEEQLQAAMQELEAVKASEAIALKKLEDVTERTMRARASSALLGSTITIPKFEYDYLCSYAAAAQEVADKKAAASQAWIDALKAREKEALMRAEQLKREIKDLKAVEEEEAYRTEKPVVAQEAMQEELRNWRQDEQETVLENLKLAAARPKKSMRDNVTPVGKRKSKTRRASTSLGTRHSVRSPSIAMLKKRGGNAEFCLLPSMQETYKA